MRFKNLCEPGRIGKLEVRNRMVLAPMSHFGTKDGFVTDEITEYYMERARGGVGLLISECHYSNPGGHPHRLHIWHDKYIPGLKGLTKAIHQTGAKIAMQINMSRGRHDEIEKVSASDVPDPLTGAKPRALTVEEIKTITEGYGNAVRRARDAGFDAVEIHGMSYLIAEFLSPLTNKRTDEYGGDFLARARFALETVESAKARAGRDYPLYYKVSYERGIDGGFSLKDAVKLCGMLQEAGVECIEATSGNLLWCPEYCVPPAALPLGVNADFSKELKEALNIPIIVTGAICDPYLAENILEEGKADFIGLGRPLLADPQFPNKVMGGKPEEIRKCVRCMNCIADVLDHSRPITCSVNAIVGKEKEYGSLGLPKEVKRVLIVGGGVGGMELARIAALRGHKVTLWERSDRMGGQLNVACLPPYKGELKSITEYLIAKNAKLGVKVKLNKEADAESIARFGADVVVIATGSSPLIPDIPGIKQGIEQGRVFTAVDVLTGKAEPGRVVVVIGGGSVGCETAEFLAAKYRKVTVVEMLNDVATDVPSFGRILLLRRLKDQGVKILTKVKAEEVREEGLVAVDEKGQQLVLKADSIVLAMGARPNKELFNALDGKVKELRMIGDCVSPRRISDAVCDATQVAYRI